MIQYNIRLVMTRVTNPIQQGILTRGGQQQRTNRSEVTDATHDANAYTLIYDLFRSEEGI
jgi:hypothetical protein